MTAITPPSGGNRIVGNPMPWHTVLIGVFLVGMTVWLVEQNVSSEAGFLYATLLLLGILIAQRANFANSLAELGFK